MVGVYVIPVPALAFIFLYTYRHRLNDPEVAQYMMLLYQGVRTNRYYWELVNTARKVALLVIHIFISAEMKMYKALYGCFLLYIMTMVQQRMRPYKVDLVNRIGKFIISLNLIKSRAK